MSENTDTNEASIVPDFDLLGILGREDGDAVI